MNQHFREAGLATQQDHLENRGDHLTLFSCRVLSDAAALIHSVVFAAEGSRPQQPAERRPNQTRETGSLLPRVEVLRISNNQLSMVVFFYSKGD